MITLLSPGEMRERRIALGLTLARLADRIGVHETSCGRWEAGDVEPSPANLVALVTGLRIPVRRLLDRAQDAGDVDAYSSVWAAAVVASRLDAPLWEDAEVEAALTGDRWRALSKESGRESDI